MLKVEVVKTCPTEDKYEKDDFKEDKNSEKFRLV